MRLTLRTMLAYLDNVLDPADADVLGHKIEESDFASGLVQRVRGVLHKLRLDAPKPDGNGMGNDANTVAEYLDSALPQDRVGELERVCLESDKHLCEVAACHQVLTIVLGKPADVTPHLRERIYALGDPARAVAHLPPTAAAAAAAKSGAPPVLKPNGQPAAEVAPPLEVPEYLRAGRQGGPWQFIAASAAALAMTLALLWLFGVFDGHNRLTSLFRFGEGDQQLAAAPDGEDRAAKNGDKSANADATTPSIDVPATAANATAADTTVPAAVAAAETPPTPTTVEPAPIERPTTD